jgi:hypothetical protein
VLLLGGGGRLLGLVYDWVMQKEKRRSERQGRSLILERRLWAGLPGYVLVPVRLVVFVVTLQEYVFCPSLSLHQDFPSSHPFFFPVYHSLRGKHRETNWIFPCLGLGIGNAGLQILSAVFMTYCVDCYSLRPLVVTQFLNIVRQVISFIVPVWNPVLNEKLGYGLGFGIEAIIAVAFYLPVSDLM